MLSDVGYKAPSLHFPFLVSYIHIYFHLFDSRQFGMSDLHVELSHKRKIEDLWSHMHAGG